MSRSHRPRQKDPIQDFMEIQDHRYDPGYWTLKVKNGGLTPIGKRVGGVQLSPFSRTLALFVLMGSLVFGLFLKYSGSLRYRWLDCAISLVLVFLGLWFYVRRSLKKYGLAGTVGGENKKR